MAAENIVTAESTDAELNKLAATWAYNSGSIPGWFIKYVLFAERRIAVLEKAARNSGVPVHLANVEKRSA